ncbi:MAG TPA: FAD-dependent monooxygenase, partial [Gemmatimonadaceae bacterium]|nr:FAD-dependent monooxygenase [Gemmatimonadaceae bacterium]
MSGAPPERVEVLVVGAGPTGLALALWLARFGVGVRLIDRNAGPAPFSRALGVHARTLEFYRQLGFVEDVVAGGVIVGSANLWSRRRRVARVEFANIGAGLTPFPFVLDFAQDAHERLLLDQLAKAGIEVERDSELVALVNDENDVRATIRHRDGAVSACRADFIAGCDGARSVVRKSIGAEFGGGTYQRIFYVADAIARGPAVDDGLHVDLDQADLLAIFDMKGKGHLRLVGTLLPAAGEPRDDDLTFDDVARRPIEQLRLEIDRVNWFSTYRVHHRVASRFTAGRAFLLGDAAHVHSPVGAQGMNTGIGDAVNLA